MSDAKSNRPSSAAQSFHSRQSFGMRLYRFVFLVFFRLFGRWALGRDRWNETVSDLRRLEAMPPVGFHQGKAKKRIWFHAASVGELESLWPLVQLAQANPRIEIILTVFSSSAWAHVHRLARKLENPALFAGYSPIEGNWTEALAAARPSLFVTAKYEAWPEIWNTLGLLGIPLAIIGAKPRSSLLWAKRILATLGGDMPRLLLFSFDPENEAGLAEAFPGSRIFDGSDPRWDRVFARAKSSHPRVRELTEEFSDLPRPWGIIGSAWPSDVTRFMRGDAEKVPGTIWCVPHRTDQKAISEIEILLRERGWTPVRTAALERIRPAGKIAVLVDEMGFLAELYSNMDWAFVGGGFGSSIHSTIEPSIYGLPILGGPKGQEKFDEITLLKKQGQMRTLGGDAGNGEPSLRQWVREWMENGNRDELRKRWIEMNRRHLDASSRTWKILIETVVDGNSGEENIYTAP